MDWKELGSQVMSFAPLLGGALGGPLGASAGALLAKKFGVDNNPESILGAIQSDPEAGVKIRQIEADEFVVKGQTVQAMLLAESKSKHTTRPKIAYQAFQVVAAISIMITFGWFYAVVTANDVMIGVITGGWPFVAAIVLPFVGWLNSYFGILRKEDRDKLNAATGTKSVAESLLNKFNK